VDVTARAFVGVFNVVVYYYWRLAPAFGAIPRKFRKSLPEMSALFSSLNASELPQSGDSCINGFVFSEVGYRSLRVPAAVAPSRRTVGPATSDARRNIADSCFIASVRPRHNAIRRARKIRETKPSSARALRRSADSYRQSSTKDGRYL